MKQLFIKINISVVWEMLNRLLLIDKRSDQVIIEGL